MHFAVSPKVSFVQEFALCKQLEQSNALATGQCRLLFYSECKEIAMHHFFWDTLYEPYPKHIFAYIQISCFFVAESFLACNDGHLLGSFNQTHQLWINYWDHLLAHP